MQSSSDACVLGKEKFHGAEEEGIGKNLDADGSLSVCAMSRKYDVSQSPSYALGGR